MDIWNFSRIIFSKVVFFIGDLNFGLNIGLSPTPRAPQILTAILFGVFPFLFDHDLMRLRFLLRPPTPIYIFEFHFALWPHSFTSLFVSILIVLNFYLTFWIWIKIQFIFFGFCQFDWSVIKIKHMIIFIGHFGH